MSNFKSDPGLFAQAQASLHSAISGVSAARGAIAGALEFPPDFPFGGEVSAIVADIEAAISEIYAFSRTLSDAQGRLVSLSEKYDGNQWAISYYSEYNQLINKQYN